MHREIIAVCSETHPKHINTVCEHNLEFLNVRPGGTTGLRRVNETCSTHIVNKYISIIAVALCTFLQEGAGRVD